MKIIKILGTGCPKCMKLEEMSIKAAGELGIDYTIEKVTEVKKIMESGVMMTPALIVDDEIKAAGHVPSLEELKKLIG